MPIEPKPDRARAVEDMKELQRSGGGGRNRPAPVLFRCALHQLVSGRGVQALFAPEGKAGTRVALISRGPGPGRIPGKPIFGVRGRGLRLMQSLLHCVPGVRAGFDGSFREWNR